VAQRLMEIERRLVGLEATAREIGAAAERMEAAIAELRLKFDALLSALSSGGEAS
jgi:hypothetical protein